MAEQIARVNPFCRVTCHALFYLPQTADQVDLAQYDYVVDAVDTVSAKVELAVRCQALQVPLISAMGTGNKMDPGRLNVTDLSRTQGCPPGAGHAPGAEERGVEHLRVCYSTEEPLRPRGADGQPSRTPGSMSFVPGVAGMMMAGEVVRTLIGREAGAMKAEPSGAGVPLHGTPAPFFCAERRRRFFGRKSFTIPSHITSY